MFIYDFSGEQNSRGMTMGTFLTEEPNNGITFREMLLSFLLRALYRHGKLPSPRHAGKGDLDGNGAIDSDIIIIKDYLVNLGPLEDSMNKLALANVSNYVVQGGEKKDDLSKQVVHTILAGISRLACTHPDQAFQSQSSDWL